MKTHGKVMSEIPFIILFIILIFFGCINYLRTLIELKMEKKNTSFQSVVFFRKFFLFHSKYDLDKDYPIPEVYHLSKIYDKMVVWYYLLLMIIVLLVMTCILLDA